jgi:hypothetical protein
MAWDGHKRGEELTKMRTEMLGTAYTAQHSDCRVLEQLRLGTNLPPVMGKRLMFIIIHQN